MNNRRSARINKHRRIAEIIKYLKEVEVIVPRSCESAAQLVNRESQLYNCSIEELEILEDIVEVIKNDILETENRIQNHRKL